MPIINSSFRSSKILILVVLAAPMLFSFGELANAFFVTSRIIMRETPNMDDSNVFKENQSYSDVLNRYKIRRRYHLGRAQLVSGAEYGLKTLGNLGFSSARRFNPALAAIGGQVYGDVLAAIGNSLRGSIYSEMEKALEMGMKNTVLRDSELSLQELAHLPKNKVRQLIYKYPEVFDFTKFERQTQGETDLKHELALEVLTNKLAEETFINTLQTERQKVQGKAIDQIDQELDQLNVELNQQKLKIDDHIEMYQKFTFEVQSNMAALAKSSQSIVEQVKVNYESILNNGKQINNLQQSLFNKMTGKEKIYALKTGWFPHLTEKQRHEELIAADAQDDSEIALKQIGHAINNLPNIARLITSDPKTLNDINKICSLANGAMNVMASTATLGPIGGVLAFAGMAGGLLGGGNLEAEIAASRHTQIMNQFRKIIDNQLLISQQISETAVSLAEGQQQIYQLLEASANELVQVSSKIDDYHKEEMEKLDMISSYTLTNTRLLNDLANRDPRQCHKFLGTKQGDSKEIRRIDKFANYEDLKEYFHSRTDLYPSCVLGLLDVVTNHQFGSNIHSLLLAESYNSNDDQNYIDWQIEKIYKPVYDFYASNVDSKEPLPTRSLIHLASLENYVGLVLEIYPFTILIEDPRSLKLVENLSQASSRRYAFDRSRLLLESSLEVIDEAIFQQEVIVGHGVVDIFFNRISGAKTKAEIENLRRVVDNNPVLKQNLIKYVVQKRLSSEKISPLYYDNLLISRNAHPFLNRFFSNLGIPKMVENIWHLDFGLETATGPLLVELPDVERILFDRWLYTPEMLILHELRSKVVDHLSLIEARAEAAQ